MRKVVAQRKFAQGASVPSAPVQGERRAVVESTTDHNIINIAGHQNVIITDVSATKLLDSVAFASTGMHLHSPRVVLERLQIGSTRNSSATQTVNKKSHVLGVLEDAQPSSVMCQSSESDDDLPLNTYHMNSQRHTPKVPNTITPKKCAEIATQTPPFRETEGRKRRLEEDQTAKSDNKRSRLRSHISECSKRAICVATQTPPFRETEEIAAPSMARMSPMAVSDEILNTSTSAETNPFSFPFTSTSNELSSTETSPRRPIRSTEAPPNRPMTAGFRSTEAPRKRQIRLTLRSRFLSACRSIRSTEAPPNRPIRSTEAPPNRSIRSTEAPPNRSIRSTEAPPNRPIRSTEAPPNRSIRSTEAPPNRSIRSTEAPPNRSMTAEFSFTEAPVYRPTSADFSDPLKYYIKIAPEASKYGLCKVVAPDDFKPESNLNILEKLDAHRQYVARLFKRWGEATRILSAVYACFAAHGEKLRPLPLVNGIEINLPKLFRIVQKYGGFNEVTRKQRWSRVAEELNLSDIRTPKLLDNIYVKHLLPYDILNESERMAITSKVEDIWLELHEKILKRAYNPLHCKKVYTGESDASGSEEDEPSVEVKQMRKKALELEECVGPGRKMDLNKLQQVDSSAKKIFFDNQVPTAEEVENHYWEIVLQGADHVCTYSVSVDTSTTQVGFTTDPKDPMSRHPWNLKNILNNDKNILRSLGAVVSMTAPILHLGMLFTTNCWYRDPHGLPWVEYLHSGSGKIWYGIAKEDTAKFRAAVEAMCPTAAQNKKIWLPSDITMIPPKLLMQEGVSITRTVQKPGEFIFIFPKAYSSSVCTGLTVSESVYFAVQPWLTTIHKVFQDLRESCEPMTFAPEQLLIALSRDERVSLAVLQQIFPNLRSTVEEELSCRHALLARGLPEVFVGQENPNQPWNVSESVECDVCRRPLFLSKVTGKFQHPHLKKTCPQDAKQIIEKFNQKSLVLEVLVSGKELRKIVSTVQNKLLIVN